MTDDVGFSGTREGMTRSQADAVAAILALTQPARAHHGAGPGGLRHTRQGSRLSGDGQFAQTARRPSGSPSADAQFVLLCRKHSPQTRITAHPGPIGVPEGFPPSDETEEPREFLARDRDIAEVIGALIAAPDSDPPRYRSGTATTMRYTRSAGGLVVLVDPAGRVSLRNGDGGVR